MKTKVPLQLKHSLEHATPSTVVIFCKNVRILTLKAILGHILVIFGHILISFLSFLLQISLKIDKSNVVLHQIINQNLFK